MVTHRRGIVQYGSCHGIFPDGSSLSEACQLVFHPSGFTRKLQEDEEAIQPNATTGQPDSGQVKHLHQSQITPQTAINRRVMHIQTALPDAFTYANIKM